MLRAQFDNAAAAIDEGLALLAETDERIWEAELHRLRGKLLCMTGDADAARDHLERAITVARDKREKSLELRAVMDLYRVDRSAPLREQVQQTYDWFTEGFETADLRAAQALLTESL